MVRETKNSRSRVRSGIAVVAVGALAAGIVSIPAAPAHAADTITAADQSYFSYYGLDRARAKGYTGKGVTVAIIDGEVDTSVPELEGAHISAQTMCTITSSPGSRTHGTAVASVLVSNGYGIAPSASLLTYRTGSKQDGDQASTDCIDGGNRLKYGYPWLINAAINDGAQIVNLSSSSTSQDDDLKWTIARSIAQGVIVVASAGNEASDSNAASLSQWSGVVGVAAIGADGNRQDYSSWGQGVTTTAIGGPVAVHDFASGQVSQQFGTSFSAPIVTGVLALAKQRWPEATSNQLLQLLVKTGLNPDHGWNQYTGFGAIDPGAILNTDPSQFDDENPLMEKQGGSSPTLEEVQQYADGVVDPAEIENDNSYIYRGLDESKLGDWQNVYPTHLGTSPRYHKK
ncbi:MAG: S8 family peptidase [Schaalia odontolytica]